MKKYSSFFVLIKRAWPLVLLGFALNFLFGVLKTEGAVYLQKITDTLESGSMDNLLVLVLIGGGLTYFSYVVRWLGAIVLQFLQEKFSCETRIRLWDHLTKIPFLRYESYSPGELQSVIQNDSKKASQAIYAVLSRIGNNLFLFICSIWVMAATNLLATVIAVAIVIAATLVNQAILKRMKRYDKAAQQDLADMTSSLERTFAGIETVKTAGAGNFVLHAYQNNQEAYCNNRMKSTKIGAMRTLWYSVTENLCLYGSVLFLGILGVQGIMTVGEVLMFIYLVKQIIMPIEVIFRWMASLPGSAASWERIESILSVESEPDQQVNKQIAVAESLDLTGIDFAYEADRKILSDAEMHLKTGTISRLAGESGSGKTTQLKVLMGLYHSPQMLIRADGEPTTAPSPKDVAFSSIDNSVFPMSVHDNIALGNQSIHPSDSEELLSELGFSDWIKSLSDGIYTVLGEGLSGGQKQSIANARALLSGRKILIFDEPYSALDTDKETRLNNILEEISSSRLTILTSHRKGS